MCNIKIILILYDFLFFFLEYLACNVAFNALCECANLRIVATVILWALVTLIPTYALWKSCQIVQKIVFVHFTIITPSVSLNPYPANVENMVSS